MADTQIVTVGCDHAGYDYKDDVIQMVKKHGYTVIDHGTNSTESTDYPDHIHPVGCDLDMNDAAIGIILCGSGNGAAMTANKHQSVRAALCWSEEIASLARQHNDANVLAIPARFVDKDTALKMVEIFLTTPFEGGRHQRRVSKIPAGDSNVC